jgi:hypothetical protein
MSQGENNFSFVAATTRIARRSAWLESFFVSTFAVTAIATCARRAITRSRGRIVKPAFASIVDVPGILGVTVSAIPRATW